VAALPQALAVIDLALWDLAGRRAGEPVWKLLGAPDASPVEVNATVGAVDGVGAAREAGARATGFGCIKVKVKVGVGDDAGRLAAVRAAIGPELSIRIDVNGVWSVDEALASLRCWSRQGSSCARSRAQAWRKTPRSPPRPRCRWRSTRALPSRGRSSPAYARRSA
jgi:L-alanine-DL-glutamate epimerase-like enolase superfamily enzyme